MLFRKMACTIATAGLVATTASLVASQPAQAEICLWGFVCIHEPVTQPRLTREPSPVPQPSTERPVLEVERSSTSSRTSQRIRSMRFDVPANQTWFDTEIDLQPGEVLSIEASGYWSNGGDNSQGVSARGFHDFYHPDAIDSAIPFASLIGNLGDGETFMVGSSRSKTIRDSGRLYLSMNDVPGTFSDNSGTLTVEVLVTQDF